MDVVMSLVEKMRTIIENECFLQDIEADYISKGCEYAIYEYQQDSDFARSVASGIAVAKKCQYNSKWSLDSTPTANFNFTSTSKHYKSL